MAQDNGEVVLTIDYALLQENIEWIYNTSRAHGFIPFVGNRLPDQYVELVLPE